MGFPSRSELANENHSEAGSSKQWNAMSSVLIKPHFFCRLSSQISFETLKEHAKRELYDEKLEDALKMLDLEWSKDNDTKTQCNWLNTSPLHRGDRPTRMVQHSPLQG